MDTKLKKRRPWATFLFFAGAMSLLLVSGWILLYLYADGDMKTDYKETYNYTLKVGKLAGLAYRAAENGGNLPVSEYEAAGNVTYFVRDANGYVWNGGESGISAQTADEFITNVKKVSRLSDPAGSQGEFSGQWGLDGYDHLIVIRNGLVSQEMFTRRGFKTTEGRFEGSQFEKLSAPEHLNQQERESMNSLEYGNDTPALPDEIITDMPEVCIAVRTQGKLLNSGTIYGIYYNWYWKAIVVLAVGTAALVSLLVLLVVFIKRRSLKIATALIARGMGHVWLEVKLFLSVALLLTIDRVGGFHLYFLWESAIFLLLCFWWVWLLLVDICGNGRKVFTTNSVTTAIRFMKGLEGKYGFLVQMKRRPIILVGMELFMAAVMLLFWALAAFDDNLLFGVLLFIPLAAAVFFLLRYLKEYNSNIDAFSRIIDYVDEIRGGEAAHPLELTGDFASLSDNLNQIHSGISKAVEEQVRSEKMKVELVSNVSHDLKTPLTSIINYVDLLARENLQPDFANDYVKILEQKSMRLKNLVQDLFEISKANSGAVELHPEHLDVAALVEQTIAEMDERLDQAGVGIKIQLPPHRLMVCADGKKLHRVFENLLGNALKYSLSGTRVYITVQALEDWAEITFKNVASYEMTFTAEDIVERFQRGDTSRATEGSGLGLAIAKSFIELSGGALRIELDGDLFKAIVTVPTVEIPPVTTVPEAELPVEPATAPPQPTVPPMEPLALPVEQAAETPAETGETT